MFLIDTGKNDKNGLFVFYVPRFNLGIGKLQSIGQATGCFCK